MTEIQGDRWLDTLDETYTKVEKLYGLSGNLNRLTPIEADWFTILLKRIGEDAQLLREAVIEVSNNNRR